MLFSYKSLRISQFFISAFLKNYFKNGIPFDILIADLLWRMAWMATKNWGKQQVFNLCFLVFGSKLASN